MQFLLYVPSSAYKMILPVYLLNISCNNNTLDLSICRDADHADGLLLSLSRQVVSELDPTYLRQSTTSLMVGLLKGFLFTHMQAISST